MESLYKKYNEKKFYEKDAKQIRLNFLQNNRNKITRITKKKSNNILYSFNQDNLNSDRLAFIKRNNNIKKDNSLQISFEPNLFNTSQQISFMNNQIKNYSLNKYSVIPKQQKIQKQYPKNKRGLFLKTDYNQFLQNENLKNQKFNSDIVSINNLTFSTIPTNEIKNNNKLSDRGNSNDITNRRTQESLNIKNSSNNYISKSKLIITGKLKPLHLHAINKPFKKNILLSSFDLINNNNKNKEKIDEDEKCISEEVPSIVNNKNLTIKKNKFSIIGIDNFLNKNKFRAVKNSETNDIYDVLNDKTNYLYDFKTINKEREERKNMKSIIRKLNMNKIKLKEKNIFSTNRNLIYEDYISNFFKNFEE